MSDEITIEKVEKRGISILMLEGALDPWAAAKLERVLADLIRTKKQYRIIVDFTELRDVDFAGLGVFMEFIEEIREKHGDIVICQADRRNVRRVLELVNFDRVFAVVDSLEEAMRRLLA